MSTTPVNAIGPLYAQLRDRLRTDILEGRLKPQQQLPSESELIAANGVSRITVRQALNDLLKEGLIVKVHGKGSFVAPPRVTQDLTQLRGLAEAVSAQGRTIHTRVLSWTDLPASPELARELAVAPGAGLSELQSLRYLNREPLSLNLSFMTRALGARLRKIDLQSRDLLNTFEADLGLAIGHAEMSISAVAAGRLQAKHLRVRAGTPLLRVHRVLFAKDGEPLHSETASYRSDEFSYKLRLDRSQR